MKKLLSIFLVLVLVLSFSLVTAVPALAWDVEDSLVIANEDFIDGVGWDGVSPWTSDVASSERHRGGQSWEYDTNPGDGYSLYRDDVSGSGNLDRMWSLAVRNPDALELLGFTISFTWEDSEGPFYYMDSEVSSDTWYWATEPRGYDNPEPVEPVLVRSPNAFDVFVRWGYDSTRYTFDGALAGSIDVAGLYNDAQYRLEIPEGCIVTGATGRINWLLLGDIDGDVLSFIGGDATFSEPCTIYIAEGGWIHQDYRTGEWLGDGEWVEVGTFTSIVDGEAHLD